MESIGPLMRQPWGTRPSRRCPYGADERLFSLSLQRASSRFLACQFPTVVTNQTLYIGTRLPTAVPRAVWEASCFYCSADCTVDLILIESRASSARTASSDRLRVDAE